MNQNEGISQRQFDRIVEANPYAFTPAFKYWVMVNQGRWLRFRNETLWLIEEGQKHSSFMEVLTSIRFRKQGGLPSVNINNDFGPDLSRLFVLLYPEHFNFFSFAVRPTLIGGGCFGKECLDGLL